MAVPKKFPPLPKIDEAFFAQDINDVGKGFEYDWPYNNQPLSLNGIMYSRFFGLLRAAQVSGLLQSLFSSQASFTDTFRTFKQWLSGGGALINDIAFVEKVIGKPWYVRYYYRLFNINDFCNKFEMLCYFNRYIQVQKGNKYQKPRLILTYALGKNHSLKNAFEKESSWVEYWAKAKNVTDEEAYFARIRAQNELEKERFYRTGGILPGYGSCKNDDKESSQDDVAKKEESFSDLFVINHCLKVLELPPVEGLIVPYSESQLKSAYRDAMHETHPDKKGWSAGEKQFSLVQNAFEQLCYFQKYNLLEKSLVENMQERHIERGSFVIDSFINTYYKERKQLDDEMMKYIDKAKSESATEQDVNHMLNALKQFDASDARTIDLLRKSISTVKQGYKKTFEEMQRLKQEIKQKNLGDNAFFIYQAMKLCCYLPLTKDFSWPLELIVLDLVRGQKITIEMLDSFSTKLEALKKNQEITPLQQAIQYR